MAGFSDEDPAAEAADLEGDGSGGSDSKTTVSTGPPNPLRRAFAGGVEGPDVNTIQSDYDTGKPTAMVLRGVMRMGSGDGMPPVGDIFLGVLLAYLAWQADREPSESDGSDESDGYETVEPES